MREVNVGELLSGRRNGKGETVKLVYLEIQAEAK